MYAMKPPLKQMSSMRLTEEGWRLLRVLAERSGVPMTAIVEMAIRDEARRHGIPIRTTHDELTEEV
jgi:hypothetical protein